MVVNQIKIKWNALDPIKIVNVTHPMIISGVGKTVVDKTLTYFGLIKGAYVTIWI